MDSLVVALTPTRWTGRPRADPMRSFIKARWGEIFGSSAMRVESMFWMEMDFEARIREYAKKQTSVDLRKTLR